MSPSKKTRRTKSGKKKKRSAGKPSGGRKTTVDVPTMDETGDIRQGTIAKFMRKRTQLVGFETGLNKHTQFSIEFLDNAIDALESWWWKTDKRPRLKDSLDPELVQEIRDKLEGTLHDSIALSKRLEKDVRAGKEVDIPPRRKETLDEQLTRFRKFLVPFRSLIKKREPLAVMQLTEVHMPDLIPLDDDEGLKVYEFIFFENGVAMIQSDLDNYGIYME
ncbi:MAG: hypothetical protein E3J82_05450, partial [Candidatus Thorarchaeota archaeon]